MEINAKAPVVVRKKILVQAPIRAIWGLLSDINQWKYWQPEVKNPVLNGPFQAGSHISYTALKLPCILTLKEVVTPKHLAWAGQSGTTVATTIWNLEETPEGVWVKADSSFEGWSAWTQCWLLYPMTHLVLGRCLRKLKRAAEQPA